MEFLVISNTKLKIKMNKKEMKRYSLDVPEEKYNTPEIRASLWRVLDAARAECGFSAEGERLLIQLYSSEGGCEVFVTKLGHLAASAERNIARSGSVTMLSSKSTLYRFPDFAALLSALRHVRAETRPRCTDVYLSDDVCYLLVEERTGTPPLSDLSFLGEFAAEAPTTLAPHLGEHALHLDAKHIFDVIT